MKSLLRADLSRVFKHKSVVYTMFIVLLIIALLYAVFVPVMQDIVNKAAETDAEMASMTSTPGFQTPLHYATTALLLFGNVGFLTCWAVVSVAWADARTGYDRTIISAIGKKTYYREKFILATVVSAVFTVGITVIGCIASGIVSGYTEMNSVVGFIEWVCLTIILAWSCSCLSLLILWYFRNSTIAYIAGFVLCTGLLSTVLGLVFGNISPDAVEAWNNFCKWLPTGSFGALQSIVDGSPDFSTENLLHIIVAPVVCLAVSYNLAFHRLTKRDI